MRDHRVSNNKFSCQIVSIRKEEEGTRGVLDVSWALVMVVDDNITTNTTTTV